MLSVSPDKLSDWIDCETGVSQWIKVDQDRIDAFATCTEDFQFIHVDPERARAEGGFDGTIAHGFLSLSLLSRFAMDARLSLQGVVTSINYGFDKLRFVNPVASGASIRGRFVLREAVERKPGQWMLAYDVTVEIADQKKPAIVARWLTLQIIR